MTDIEATLARIDDAVTDRPLCAFCRYPLPPDAPSADFCSEACQIRWTRREQRTEALPADWSDVELMFDGFRTAFVHVAEVANELFSALAASVPAMPLAGGSYARVTLTNPDDPSVMERALLARRRRNTGPASQYRPPRNIGYEATLPVSPRMGRPRPRG